MVFWQSHICFVLLLAFSSLNLIYSDCGTDVDRFNGDKGFCDSRNLRRTDASNYDKDLSRRRIEDFGERRSKFFLYKNNLFLKDRIFYATFVIY